MLTVDGIYFDGKSSKGTAARASIDASGQLLLTYEGGERRAMIGRLVISPRVGNSSRFIAFDDGAKFETADNDAVDAALRYGGGKTGLLHRLESRLHFIIPALLGVILATVLLIRDGIPALSDFLAAHLPAGTNRYLADKTLEGLDERFFKASRLSAERGAELQRRFERIVGELPADAREDFAFRLLFRESEPLGANAFALPSGTVVVTDALVSLARTDDELTAILAHEIGHVIHRHGLRHIIRNSLLSVLIVWITGDASGASTFIASLPALLINLQYSRDFEREADEYSLRYLLAHGISPRHFICIMQRLEAEYGDNGKTHAFLSTHPATGERLEAFRRHLGDDTADCDQPKATLQGGSFPAQPREVSRS